MGFVNLPPVTFVVCARTGECPVMVGVPDHRAAAAEGGGCAFAKGYVPIGCDYYAPSDDCRVGSVSTTSGESWEVLKSTVWLPVAVEPSDEYDTERRIPDRGD